MRKLIYRDDIALAMELRTEGCSWANIAIGLGVHCPEVLRDTVRRAQRNGRESRPSPILAPQGSSDDLQATDQGGEGARADAGAAVIPRLGEAVGHDALRAEEEWIGDSNRAIDREVYGA